MRTEEGIQRQRGWKGERRDKRRSFPQDKKEELGWGGGGE